MLSLEASIEQFVRIASENFAGTTFGAADPAFLSRLKTTLPLSKELLAWYQSAAPKEVQIEWCSGELVFLSPEALLDQQIGYRWARQEGNPRIAEWKEEWIVIAHVDWDPVIADVSMHSTPILMDFRGKGKWEPKVVAPNLASFLMTMVAWIEISQGKYGGQWPELVEDSESEQRLRSDFSEALAPFLGEEHRSNLFDFLK